MLTRFNTCYSLYYRVIWFFAVMCTKFRPDRVVLFQPRRETNERTNERTLATKIRHFVDYQAKNYGAHIGKCFTDTTSDLLQLMGTFWSEGRKGANVEGVTMSQVGGKRDAVNMTLSSSITSHRSPNPSTWTCLDFGASQHLFINQELLTDWEKDDSTVLQVRQCRDGRDTVVWTGAQSIA